MDEACPVEVGSFSSRCLAGFLKHQQYKGGIELGAEMLRGVLVGPHENCATIG